MRYGIIAIGTIAIVHHVLTYGAASFDHALAVVCDLPFLSFICPKFLVPSTLPSALETQFPEAVIHSSPLELRQVLHRVTTPADFFWEVDKSIDQALPVAHRSSTPRAQAMVNLLLQTFDTY